MNIIKQESNTSTNVCRGMQCSVVRLGPFYLSSTMRHLNRWEQTSEGPTPHPKMKNVGIRTLRWISNSSRGGVGVGGSNSFPSCCISAIETKVNQRPDKQHDHHFLLQKGVLLRRTKQKHLA